MKQKNAELAVKVEQMLGIESEKGQLETRIAEIGSQMDKMRRKEAKMKYVSEQFKSQLET